jgi:hypothetical protein
LLENSWKKENLMILRSTFMSIIGNNIDLNKAKAKWKKVGANRYEIKKIFCYNSCSKNCVFKLIKPFSRKK